MQEGTDSRTKAEEMVRGIAVAGKDLAKVGAMKEEVVGTLTHPGTSLVEENEAGRALQMLEAGNLAAEKQLDTWAHRPVSD